MLLAPDKFSKREKLVLTGLYFAKYDSVGLKKLGFSGFVEGFNVVGYALSAKPASVKNYRDEFDPLFPNRRKGWHKRPTREYCLKIYEEYRDLDLETFASLIESFVGDDGRRWIDAQEPEDRSDDGSAFAKRMITGIAAENYFESVRPTLVEFQGWAAENTTRLGCGFDFRLSRKGQDEFLAVEVKGLAERTGSVSMTSKEHEVAARLAERYFLFVVRNFHETPFHAIFRNPLYSGLRFKRKERATVHVSWLTNI